MDNKFFLIVSLIFPISFFLIFFILRYVAFKKINRFSGFRTKNSMKNQKNWKYANKTASKLSLYMGFISFIFTLIFIKVFSLDDLNLIILILIQFTMFLLINIITEYKLRKFMKVENKE